MSAWYQFVHDRICMSQSRQFEQLRVRVKLVAHSLKNASRDCIVVITIFFFSVRNSIYLSSVNAVVLQHLACMTF